MEFDIRIFGEAIDSESMNLFYFPDEREHESLEEISRICNIEQELFNSYYSDRDNFDFSCEKDINYKNIFEDVRVTIKSFEKKENMNACLSKLMLIRAYPTKELFEKYKPFLLFGNGHYDLEDIPIYEKINPLYKYLILYSNIMYHTITTDIELDFVEYNLIKACIDSANMYMFKKLMVEYKKTNKCYKLLDFENEKFLENEDNIELDEEELKSRLQFNIHKYKYERT